METKEREEASVELMRRQAMMGSTYIQFFLDQIWSSLSLLDCILQITSLLRSKTLSLKYFIYFGNDDCIFGLKLK